MNQLQNFISQKLIKLFERNFQQVFLYTYIASPAIFLYLALSYQKRKPPPPPPKPRTDFSNICEPTVVPYNAVDAMALILISEVFFFSSRSGDGANILGAKSTISCGNSVTK